MRDTVAVIVRDEQPQDAPDVSHVVEQVFGRPDEAGLVERLRSDGEAALSLVAVAGGRIVGHVMLSPMAAPFRALGLAPLSVLLEFQRRGVGAALMETAIARARLKGWAAIFVLGDPAYYGRFGFRADLAAGFVSPYVGPHFMVLPLDGALPIAAGRVDYAPAFGDLA